MKKLVDHEDHRKSSTATSIILGLVTTIWQTKMA